LTIVNQVNIVPVIGKADTLTKAELSKLKKRASLWRTDLAPCSIQSSRLRALIRISPIFSCIGA
jgi:septin family protein